MKAKASPNGRPGLKRPLKLLLAGSLLTSGGWLAGQETPADEDTAAEAAPDDAPAAEEEEEPLEYSNWIEFGLGGTWVDGDKTAYQARRQQPGDTAFGGLTAGHYEAFVGDNGFFTLDGRAVFEQNDYNVHIGYEHTDLGYVKAGFRQFRTWSDGVGGYLPAYGSWVPLQDRDLHLDRGEAFLEAGLTLPSWPEIHFRYSHLFRDGKKDSTIGGQVNVPTGLRGIGASFYDLDETRDIFSLDATHTVKATDLGLGVRYELSSLDNSLNLRQLPGNALESYVTQKDETETDLFNVHAHSTTRLNDDLMFSAAYAYTTLETELGGSRIYGANYDSVYDPFLARGPGFIALAGGSGLDQHVANFNLHWMALEHLAVIPSLRVERSDVDGDSSWLDTPSLALKDADHERGLWEISESLEARYDAIRDWLFYAEADWSQGSGDLKEHQIALATGATELNRDTDDERWTQKYTLGANWYPLNNLNLAGQYYHKIHNYDYDHNVDSTPNNGVNRYPAYLTRQDFTTDDFNARVTWRPVNAVTLVSRYDFQLSTVDTQADGLSELESADLTSHIFSESVTWSPLHWLYLQGGLNYVLNEMETPASNDATPDGLVQDSENNYWIGTFTAGVALNQKTDLQGSYFYSRADNYQDNSTISVPYGAGYEEHGVTATLTRELRRGLIATLSYGWFKTRDQATAGFTDFESHLVYSSLVYRW